MEKGESKIERGLNEFRLYRVAPADRLLHLQPSGEDDAARAYYQRTLHFTTQKNMALEYRNPDGRKTVLLEQRGKDFLEDLRDFETSAPDVRLLLLSHEDLRPMAAGNLKGMRPEDAQRFLASRTYRPSEVSLRAFRQSAEVAVFMPEGEDVLLLTQSHLKIKGLKGLVDAAGKRDGRYPYGSGGFHVAAGVRHHEGDPRLKKLQAEKRALERAGERIVEEIVRTARQASPPETEAVMQARREEERKRRLENEREISELRWRIQDLHDGT